MAYLRKTSNANLKGMSGVSGFPVIIDENFKVHTVSLHYFLYCLDSTQASSVGTYGAHICDFISQLEADGKEVSEINDSWLKSYKEAIIKRDVGAQLNTQNYASQVLRSVVSYCLWLTDNNYEPYLCGLTKNHKIQISYSDSNRVKHPTIKNINSDKRHVQAPRTDWIERIKPYGPQRSDLAKRFELMIDWGRLAGLRSHEICHLQCEHLPSRATAEKAVVAERLVPTKLTVTKGNRTEVVRVPPSLVIATWDYIDLYRECIVKKFIKLHKKDRVRSAYKKPSAVFLSDKTGQLLNPVSFSLSVRDAFLKAVEKGQLTEDERVWAHGLRHNFVTKTLKEYDESGQKHPERLTMQSSRHSSLDAMQTYAGDRYSKDFS